MTQLKYPNHPITKPQIKKIHTLKSLLGLSDDNYEALLYRFGVETSKDLTRATAVDLIDTLDVLLNGTRTKKKNTHKTPIQESLIKNKATKNEAQQQTGLFWDYPVYFDRSNNATDKQIMYIVKLWADYSEYPEYVYLLKFIQRVTKEIYLHLERISVKEASHVIVALEKWFKIKKG